MHKIVNSGIACCCSSTGHGPDRRFRRPAIPSVLCTNEVPSFSPSSRSNNDLERLSEAPLIVEACSRRRPLPLVAFLLRMGPALASTGDSSVGVGRGESAGELRFKLLT